MWILLYSMGAWESEDIAPKEETGNLGHCSSLEMKGNKQPLNVC